MPISKNSLYPSEATNHTTRLSQQLRTSGRRTCRSFAARLPHPLRAPGRGRRATPGHDVTAPGSRRGQAVSRNAAGAGQGGPRILARFSSSRPSSQHLPGLCPGLHLSLWRRVRGLQAPRERRGGGLRGWAGAPGWSRRPRRTGRSHPVAGATGGGEAAGWAGGGGRSSRRE